MAPHARWRLGLAGEGLPGELGVQDLAPQLLYNMMSPLWHLGWVLHVGGA